jgi:predicted lipoprotein with Yx(FWY)xxD motif
MGRGVAALLVASSLGAGVAVGLASATLAPDVAGASRAQVVRVSTAKVAHVGTVLTTGSGRTLYYFTANPLGKSLCTGACAQIWPPDLASKGAHIRGPHGVKGLSLISVGSGHWQVAFHNNALYRFKSDTRKGQAGGQGVLGKWFAALKSGIPATAAGAPVTAPTSTSTTAPSTSTTQTPQAPPGSAPVPQAPTTTGPASQTPAPMPMAPPPPAVPTPTNAPPATPPPTTPTTSTPTTMAPSSGGASF